MVAICISFREEVRAEVPGFNELPASLALAHRGGAGTRLLENPY
jgi:hypothetical protein